MFTPHTTLKSHIYSQHYIYYKCCFQSGWPLIGTVFKVRGGIAVVEVLLYVHRSRRFIRDGGPGRPPRLSHTSWARPGWDTRGGNHRTLPSMEMFVGGKETMSRRKRKSITSHDQTTDAGKKLRYFDSETSMQVVSTKCCVHRLNDYGLEKVTVGT